MSDCARYPFLILDGTKLRVGAFSIQSASENITEDSTCNLHVCRTCLAMNVKLYPINKYKMEEVFENVTGLSNTVLKEKLPQYVCTECATRLLNCQKFINKSIRANNLLLEILQNDDQLSLDNLSSINREHNNLTSDLSPGAFNSNKLYNITHEPCGHLAEVKIECIKEDGNKNFFIKKEQDTENVCDDVGNIEMSVDEVHHEEQVGYEPEDKDLGFSNLESGYDEDFLLEKVNKRKINKKPIQVKKKNISVNKVIRVKKKSTPILTQKVSNSDEQDIIEQRIRVETSKTENSIVDVDKETVLKRKNKPNTLTNKVKGDIGNGRSSNEDKDFETDKSTLSVLRSNSGDSIIPKDGDAKGIEIKPVRVRGRYKKRKLNRNEISNTLFTITDMSVEEQKANLLKRRESYIYTKSKFQCNDCYRGFMDENVFNNHRIRHTDQWGKNECEICKTRFKHEYDLRKHFTAHHTQQFSCNKCSFSTVSRHSARLHERWHSGKRYECPHCSLKFDKFSTYMGHLRIKHPSNFSCEFCGFSFVSGKGVEMHKNLMHRLDSKEIPADGPCCDCCSVKFASEDALKRHLFVSGKLTGIDRNYELTKKKRLFSRQPHRIHPGQQRVEGPISCEQCNVQLNDMRAYHHHFKNKHPDKNRTHYPTMPSPFMCEICGKLFKCPRTLEDHKRVHTGEKPFPCDVCGKHFHSKPLLSIHRRGHKAASGRTKTPTSFSCQECGKQFSWRANWKRHMVIHTGSKRHVCEICGKAFSYRTSKTTHVATVHMKKPWPKRIRKKPTQEEM